MKIDDKISDTCLLFVAKAASRFHSFAEDMGVGMWFIVFVGGALGLLFGGMVPLMENESLLRAGWSGLTTSVGLIVTCFIVSYTVWEISHGFNRLFRWANEYQHTHGKNR